MGRVYNLVISGVGGQGIITASDIIGRAAILRGFKVRGAEVHGMAQRGGAVITHIRISEEDREMGPLVPRGGADLVLALEPIEALRAFEYANERTAFIVNEHPIKPPIVNMFLARYPRLDDVFREIEEKSGAFMRLDATRLARELGDVRVANTIMIGAAIASGRLPLDLESVEESIRRTVKQKYIEINIRALRRGFELGENFF